MDSCIELNEELARMDKELKTSTLYVTKVSHASIMYNSQYIMDKLFPVLVYMLFLSPLYVPLVNSTKLKSEYYVNFTHRWQTKMIYRIYSLYPMK